ncbi:uncharacterized protein LOC129976585 [Argiope bruennichi]|uniref:uncharacterized protein LOC129976585 n=1 Tax=Argiope bruennichi TaxID=94029 RepID=UPI002495A51A|nr:uncharacterized protein LOC129976585 [Argiope bruennichi]
MYLAIVFVVLFRITSGLILHSGLDPLFHDLNDRNAEFYHVKNTGKSKPINSDEAVEKEPIFTSFLKTDVRSENLKTSPAFRSSVMEDPSKDITVEASKVIYENILEDTLENVGGEADDVLNNRILKDSSDIIDEKIGESLSGESLARKTRAAIQNSTKECKNSSEITVETVVEIEELDEGNRCSCKSVVTSLPKVPAVFIFVNTFIKNVQSSELLTILFDITDAAAQQYSQFKYRFIADFCRRLGFINANVIAAFSVRTIAKYFDVIPPQVLIEVSANYIAKVLFVEGILTADNAQKLASMYCKKLEESAKILEIDCESSYIIKFQALADGWIRFVQYFGEFSYSESWEIAFYYDHEWLLAAVDYGTLRNVTA